MAVNPLYRNEYYFFSGMYDDSLITDFYRKITSESYDRSVLYQHNMLGRKQHIDDRAIFYKSSIGNFTIDDIYNAKNNLPNGSRTLKFNTLILPIFNKRKFFSVYGLINQKIPIIDFYKRSDIFDKSIVLQIGNCRIIDALFIHNDDNTVTLAIENSSINGILSSNYDKFISNYSQDEPVWVFSEELTKVYCSESNTTESFPSESKNGLYEIRIPTENAINNIATSVVHDVSNSWDCLISYKSNIYGKKILASSPCSLKCIEGTDAIFYVNDSFLNFIKTNTHSFNMFFIHRPNRKHILVYQYKENTSPILSLDYTYNPTGNINIEVFEYNVETMCKGRKLYDPEFTQVYFPNIFDFNKLNKNKSDLIIEVTEYYPTHTNQIMTNSLDPLIKSMGPEFYTEFVVNGYDTSISEKPCNLKKYSPKHYPISVDDYANSEYYGDFRGYILDKIVKTIESDPYLLASYYKWMKEKNGLSISVSGTPKALKFGTGKFGEFSGENLIVNDTSFISTSDSDIVYFNEPHSYINYYSTGKDIPSTIFVNGKYIVPTYVKSHHGIMYAFFPVDKINEELSKYNSENELIAASPFIVDIYPKSYVSAAATPVSRVVVYSLNDIISIFQDVEDPYFSLSELVVYDDTTGRYLGKLSDVFDIKLKVSKYIIENPGSSENITMAIDADIKYLMTVLNELYCTMDLVSIIIASSQMELSYNELISDLLTGGFITQEEVDSFSHKKLNFNNVELTPKDDSLIGANLVIYSTSFKDEHYLLGSDGVYYEDQNATIYEVPKANIDPTLTNYWVYIDGRLDPTATVSAISNIHNSNIQIIISGDLSTSDSEIILVHMPIEYYREDFFMTSKVFYMKDAITTEKSVDKIWPMDFSSGIVMQYQHGRTSNSYPFEDDCNPKYSSNGVRLPPSLISTNRLYSEYLSNEIVSIYGLKNGETGFVYFINNDKPITELAKQNPYSETYDPSNVVNPLDILTHF